MVTPQVLKMSVSSKGHGPDVALTMLERICATSFSCLNQRIMNVVGLNVNSKVCIFMWPR